MQTVQDSPNFLTCSRRRGTFLFLPSLFRCWTVNTGSEFSLFSALPRLRCTMTSTQPRRSPDLKRGIVPAIDPQAQGHNTQPRRALCVNIDWDGWRSWGEALVRWVIARWIETLEKRGSDRCRVRESWTVQSEASSVCWCQNHCIQSCGLWDSLSELSCAQIFTLMPKN